MDCTERFYKIDHMPPPVTVFIDTEFTGLSPIGSPCPPKLISIGAVSRADDRHFYAELKDTWRPADCTEWVVRNVLPLLQGEGAVMTLQQCAISLANWLDSLERPVKVIGSSQYDAHFFMELFAHTGLPNSLCDVQVIDWSNFSMPGCQAAIYAEELFFKQNGRQHHALNDAQAYKQGWRAGRALMFNDPIVNSFWSRSDTGAF